MASVIDDFKFTYVMLGAPTDVTAGGFPTYVRPSWSDSAVRAGMFDDQNGFFYDVKMMNTEEKSIIGEYFS